MLVITALTIPAIKDAKLTLKVLESLSVDPESTMLVVNRVDGYADFNQELIEQSLRSPVAVQYRTTRGSLATRSPAVCRS